MAVVLGEYQWPTPWVMKNDQSCLRYWWLTLSKKGIGWALDAAQALQNREVVFFFSLINWIML